MASKSTPKTSKNHKKPIIKTYGFLRFSAIWLFAPNILKSGQDTSQNDLKLAILQSKMAILGPSWRQVGQLSAILAATWPILAPRCAPTDLQIESQTRPKSHLGPSWRQEGRPGAPNPPGAQISKDLTTFSASFSSMFSSSCFNLSQTSNRRFGKVAALRAAHWIISHHTVHHIRSYHVTYIS